METNHSYPESFATFAKHKINRNFPNQISDLVQKTSLKIWD